MNRVEELLQTELNHLLDRIASATRQGIVADCLERQPELAARLGDVENELSSARQRLLQDYGSWRQALEECGDLWAVIELDSDANGSSEGCAPSESRDGAIGALPNFSPGIAPVKPVLGAEHRAAKAAQISTPRYLSPTAA
jgi:hypothetical protein